MPVAEPQKELRFTRSAQGLALGIAASATLMAAISFFILTYDFRTNEDLPHPAWGLALLAPGLWMLRAAYRCVKHAYLILTPLGVEIFPFFRPEKGMQMVLWSQITGMEITGTRLTLHFNAEQTAGIHLSLAPVGRTSRELLAHAIKGRMEQESQPPA